MEPDRARQLLQRERERVEAELASLRAGRGDGDDELSRVDQHSADAATDLFDTERDHSLIDRLEHDLAAIERAEARLAEGTYGVSVESGEPIPEGRLEVVPWAERTAEEQARYEGGS